MLNPSDYGVASPQEILKDISQGWQATSVHCQVTANLTIPVRDNSHWHGFAQKVRYHLL
jgi:hypothetical protein